jgi:hypothetical protein
MYIAVFKQIIGNKAFGKGENIVFHALRKLSQCIFAALILLLPNAVVKQRNIYGDDSQYERDNNHRITAHQAVVKRVMPPRPCFHD